MNNLEMMRKRLEYHGGIKQEDRMIKDKYRAFQRALYYSYQGCDVQITQPYHTCPLFGDDLDLEMQVAEQHRALINPDKVKQDYDDKILSIDYNTQFVPGDVFQWIGTQSYWLIYLEQLTEDAYFRGEIRRCRWTIRFKDEEGNVRYTWAAIRGPVETVIESIQKSQIREDKPNLSLNILMPLNEYTKAAFQRYDRFLFDGRAWQVNTMNNISMTNILEITAEEYYIDQNDDDIVNEIADGLIIEKVDPNPPTFISIDGESFIKPMFAWNYKSPDQGGKWSIKENVPVTIKAIGDNEVSVTWEKSISGQFTLLWEKDGITLEKIIVVESLF